jgi:micrococcal nuclease
MIKNIIILLLVACILRAEEITNFTIISVRDGDTFVIDIPDIPDVFGKNIAVRIRGIDTPEKNDEREEIRAIAYQAKQELTDLLLNGEQVVLYNLGRDKYFRLLASVRVGELDVADYLIEKKLAKPYNGGKKNVW